MARIHGVLADGTVIEGMEVFRRAYGAVGLGWLLAPTAWPGLRALADAGYRWFARNRLRLTGRGNACDQRDDARAEPHEHPDRLQRNAHGQGAGAARGGIMRLSTKLSGIELEDFQGSPVRLGSLWESRPIVLVFIRHFG